MSLTLVHDAVPGRWRVRIAALRANPVLEQLIEQRFVAIAGVRSVRGNRHTGSVLIYFEPERHASLRRELEEALATALAGGLPLPHERFEKARQRKAPTRTPRQTAAGATPAVAPGAADQGSAPPTASWHLLAPTDVLAQLASGSSGLSLAEVARRQREQGPNALPAPPRRSKLSILAGQFQSVPVAMLGASAILSLATGGVADAAAILMVVIANASIGYVTESKAEHIISSLGGGTRPDVDVVRGAQRLRVAPDAIVTGDILLLVSGTFIPADARLLDVDGLVVDESALTGESVPVAKAAASLGDERTPLAERHNMVFRGTLVTGGSGMAVVVAIGLGTQIGQVQSLVGSVLQRETPLQSQLSQLGLQVAIFAGAVCTGVFGVGLLRGVPVLRMLSTSVSLAVAAIPEGLPTVAITTLALGIRRLAERRVLVRALDAVETLGAVQIMCLDKTGTITINRMTVVAVFAGLRDLSLDASGAALPAEERAKLDLEELLRVAALCSEVELSLRDGSEVLQGSPTESALVRLALASGLDVRGLRTSAALLFTQYRSETRSYMATLHRPEASAVRPAWSPGAELDLEARAALAVQGPDELWVSVKGRSPEVLEMCRYFVRDGELALLGDRERAAIEVAGERMAGRALRVLGFACARWEGARLPQTEGFRLEFARNLVWLGLVGMSDPPREGMLDTLQKFHAAGVKTVMITGDQGATAYAIGKAVGLGSGNQLEILDATELDGMAPDMLRALVQHVHVFSRVTPAHKLQIVRALQAGGKTVAMTGDGINDSPALRAADVGVAMGGSGTDAARDVAHVILQDDNLATMIAAIEQGRTIHDNIKKAVHFILSTNLSEIIITFLGVAAGGGETLTPMQLLWINLMTDIFPELALAMQPPERDVLARPPRDPAQPMFDAAHLSRVALEAAVLSAGPIAAYAYGRRRYGAGPRSGTLAFTVLAVTQLLHVLSSRSETHTIFDRERLAGNRYIPMALGGGIALQVIATFLPGLRQLLGVAPLGLLDWGVVGIAATGPLLVNESIKVARRSGAPPERGDQKREGA